MNDGEKNEHLPLTERAPRLRLRRSGPKPTAAQLVEGSAKFAQAFPESGPPEQISEPQEENGPAVAARSGSKQRGASKRGPEGTAKMRFDRQRKTEPRTHNMTIRFTYAERVRLQEVSEKMGHASATDYLRAGIERMLEEDGKKLGA